MILENMELVKLLLCVTVIDSGLCVTKAKDINYYKILGLSRSATDRDIKKSFRTLAVKYHPDKNKEKEAEEKFKDIVQAYEILSDADKRKKFDQFGSAAFETGGYSQGNGFHFNFDDIFENFEDDFEGNTFHFSSSEGFAEQHPGHARARGSNVFNFEDFFEEEEDSFMNNHYGHESHAFGGGSSFFGSHFSHNEHMQQQLHQEQQSSQGKSCRTITQRVGNMVTTYTQCS